MKKNLVMRIAAVVLMCTLVTACFASSTFAKYTSQATGTDTARVAKWSITMNGKDIAVDGDDAITSFDLFSTSYTNVNGGEDKVVAPGTSGQFAFDAIKNESEVTSHVKVALSVENNDNIPVVFYKDAEHKTAYTDAELAALVDQDVAIDNTVTGKTIYWEWVFEKGADATTKAANDAVDTDFGKDAADGKASVIKVSLAITATQVD